MANNEAESGLELVLDNRKLIIAFGLLIAFCGCFFVVGFIEGKRQGFQEGNQTAAETLPGTVPETVLAPSEKPANEDVGTPPPQETDQQLEWYKNISRREAAPASSATQTSSESASKTPVTEAAAVRAEKPKPQVSDKPVTYSVQVGAFEKQHALETRAQMLREKGFESRIEPPTEPGQYYLLKVGNFSTRAEASAMQLRLKREGFTSFIKKN